MVIGDIGCVGALRCRGLLGLLGLPVFEAGRQCCQLLADLGELLVLFVPGSGRCVLDVFETGEDGALGGEFVGQNGANSLLLLLLEASRRRLVLRAGALSGHCGERPGRWRISVCRGGADGSRRGQGITREGLA
ncbi:hypothetical protein ACFWAN_41975 [Streptomyces mirabilis]|uniref:hypothetical protein n=1 Tax=Streptomyces mirabilis TaxID=68239 RepID=UPI003655CF7B